MFLLVLVVVIGGFWLVGSAEELAGAGPDNVPVEALWAERGAELVPGCTDARVAEHPFAQDVTGDGALEYFVTLHCGGLDGADNVLVVDYWDPDSAGYLGAVTTAVPVHLQRGGCVHPDGRTVTVIGRVRADGDPADRPSLVVKQTATWNGTAFTFGAAERSAAAAPGYGPTLPGCGRA
ncbi:hypothetical protein [Cryptosporangium japonicum]|uniref:hypothetical protein n=1 Tax=Cryptosporangium japonicum TaxID=80872 RepID=UPI0031D441B9